MENNQNRLNVNSIRDNILKKLDSVDEYFGIGLYELPKQLGYSKKDFEACLIDLEDRDFIEYPAEGKIKITPRGTYFINSSSFTTIENNRQQEISETSVDRELQRDNWKTTTKTSKWAILLAVLSFAVSILALYISWRT